nr:hypothetical protein [Moritella viscosa]SHO08496.1 Putative uncharacterized protein [Moritella viscosa]
MIGNYTDFGTGSMAKYSKIIQGFNPSLIAISDKAKEVAMQINT